MSKHLFSLRPCVQRSRSVPGSLIRFRRMRFLWRRAGYEFRLSKSACPHLNSLFSVDEIVSGKSSIAGSGTASNWQKYQHHRLRPINRPVPLETGCCGSILDCAYVRRPELQGSEKNISKMTQTAAAIEAKLTIMIQRKLTRSSSNSSAAGVDGCGSGRMRHSR